AEPGRRGRAGQDGELGREPPDLRRVRREVAGGAEERRVAERQQADVADEEIERGGEQREAERLQQADRIDDERRDHQQRGNPDGASVATHANMWRRGRAAPIGAGPALTYSLTVAIPWSPSGGDHHAVRPKRPAGRTSNTSAMITKITVFDASG